MNSGKCFPRNGSCFHCEIIFVTYEYESLAFYRCSISFVEKYLCWMNLFTFFFSEFSTYQHKTLSLHIFSTNSVGMKKITRTLCVWIHWGIETEEATTFKVSIFTSCELQHLYSPIKKIKNKQTNNTCTFTQFKQQAIKISRVLVWNGKLMLRHHSTFYSVDPEWNRIPVHVYLITLCKK